MYIDMLRQKMVIKMGKARKCAICGTDNGCGMLVMGQYICLDCQMLLDDPKRRVFGCSLNRRFAKSNSQLHSELVKAKD